MLQFDLTWLLASNLGHGRRRQGGSHGAAHSQAAAQAGPEHGRRRLLAAQIACRPHQRSSGDGEPLPVAPCCCACCTSNLSNARPSDLRERSSTFRWQQAACSSSLRFASVLHHQQEGLQTPLGASSTPAAASLRHGGLSAARSDVTLSTRAPGANCIAGIPPGLTASRGCCGRASSDCVTPPQTPPGVCRLPNATRALPARQGRAPAGGGRPAPPGEASSGDSGGPARGRPGRSAGSSTQETRPARLGRAHSCSVEPADGQGRAEPVGRHRQVRAPADREAIPESVLLDAVECMLALLSLRAARRPPTHNCLAP